MANDAKTTKKSMSKFQEILAATGQKVLDRRSDIVYRSAATAMQDKITGLERRRDAVEIELLNLTDMSVSSRDSLRPGNVNFNATSWIDQVCELNLQIRDINEEIAIAEAVQAEYFA